MLRTILLGPLALFMLLAGTRPAEAQEDMLGVRALGMGEARRAIASGPEAALLNPAGMTIARQYVIEGTYGFRAEDTGNFVNVGIADSVTSRLAVGLFYSYIYTSPTLSLDWAGGLIKNASLTRSGHAAGLALAAPLGDRFSLGATIKYLHISTQTPLPSGTVPSSLTLDQANGVTFDVGMSLRLSERISLAVIGYNLWDHGTREAPLSLGLGAALVPTAALSIGFDAVIAFTEYKTLHTDAAGRIFRDNRTTARLGPGLEYAIAGKVPIRAGVVYDSGLAATYLTAGLGYRATQFAVDLSYRAKIEGGTENFLMLGLRLFVD